jgi:glycosyltransferase involved in cell wall biosynthesis
MNIDKTENVSVIIPLYNQANYVEEALISIFNQTYKINQIIVVNDGSTDNGLEIINKFSDKIMIINKSNRGIQDTIYEGLKKTTGNFISFLDADDRWIKNKTEIQLELLSKNADIDMVFGNARRFNMGVENNIVKERIIDVMPGNTRVGGMFRRSVFEKVSYKSESSDVHEFMDWLIRAKDANLKSLNHQHIVFERRIHDNNQGVINKETQRQQYFNTIKASLDRRRANKNK